VHPDMAARLLNDSVDGRQPQAAAFAELFRREEGLEYPRLRLLVYAGPGIADCQHHVSTGRDFDMVRSVLLIELDVRNLESKPASVRHCVARIDREIHDHLLDLSGISLYPSSGGLEDRAQLYVFSDDAAQHSLHLQDDRVEIEDLGLQNLLATERKELPS